MTAHKDAKLDRAKCVFVSLSVCEIQVFELLTQLKILHIPWPKIKCCFMRFFLYLYKSQAFKQNKDKIRTFWPKESPDPNQSLES